MIIGISGKIRSGKDTVGKIIQYLTSTSEEHQKEDLQYDTFIGEMLIADHFSDWQIKKFADKLKECISIITGIAREDLEKEEVKNSYLPNEWNRVESMTVRTLLQEFGTEVGRQIHPDFWINALFADYKSKGNLAFERLDSSERLPLTNDPNDFMFPKWIITDVRFPNELKAVKDKGGIVIRVNRISSLPDDTFHKKPPYEHPSETALDNATFDYTIDNNGTIEELIEKVKEILIKEKII